MQRVIRRYKQEKNDNRKHEIALTCCRLIAYKKREKEKEREESKCNETGLAVSWLIFVTHQSVQHHHDDNNNKDCFDFTVMVKIIIKLTQCWNNNRCLSIYNLWFDLWWIKKTSHSYFFSFFALSFTIRIQFIYTNLIKYLICVIKFFFVTYNFLNSIWFLHTMSAMLWNFKRNTKLWTIIIIIIIKGDQMTTNFFFVWTHWEILLLLYVFENKICTKWTWKIVFLDSNI